MSYTLDDMAEDLIGLLDALHLNRAHLVGASMGGMIGQIATARNPNRILSFTSIMSSSGILVDEVRGACFIATSVLRIV